jgi:hypothetical protein
LDGSIYNRLPDLAQTCHIRRQVFGFEQLYNVRPLDPLVLGAVSLLLIAVALLASFFARAFGYEDRSDGGTPF